MMRLLLLGAGGMTGWEVAQRAPASGFQATAFSRSELDITDAIAVKGAIDRNQPDCVINAAAYTAVDKAEEEPQLAMMVNRDGARNAASAAARVGAALIHISTDYVFDGRGSTPYATDAAVGPLGVYGRSKLAGEVAVRSEIDRHAIVRTSWVFSHRGRNFLRTMLERAVGSSELRVVDDQVGSPTAAGDLAEALLTVAKRSVEDRSLSGTWHFSNAGVTTWYEFARAIFEMRHLHPLVRPVPASEYPAPAQRPAYSVLDTSSFREKFGAEPRPWRDALRETLERIP